VGTIPVAHSSERRGSSARRCGPRDPQQNEPAPFAAQRLIDLQRTAGNAAVQALLRAPPTRRTRKQPPVPRWLRGVPNPKHVQGQIWDISVQNLGPVYVGPYRQLTQFLAERGLSSGPHRYEAAHIANWEHLKDVGSPYSKGRAPAVAVPADMHARWTSETARVQKEWHGGRETPTHVRAEVTRGEVISVHHHLYEAHPELRRIAANVFREDRVGPAPKGGKAAAGGGTSSPGGAGKAPPPAGGATTPFAAALSKRLLGKAKVAASRRGHFARSRHAPREAVPPSEPTSPSCC
jgi:hypothetical protein